MHRINCLVALIKSRPYCYNYCLEWYGQRSKISVEGKKKGGNMINLDCDGFYFLLSKKNIIFHARNLTFHLSNN